MTYYFSFSMGRSAELTIDSNSGILEVARDARAASIADHLDKLSMVDVSSVIHRDNVGRISFRFTGSRSALVEALAATLSDIYGSNVSIGRYHPSGLFVTSPTGTLL